MFRLQLPYVSTTAQHCCSSVRVYIILQLDPSAFLMQEIGLVSRVLIWSTTKAFGGSKESSIQDFEEQRNFEH